MGTLSVMTIFGTRPEAVKMCPLVLALRAAPEVRVCCCVTGQHRELLSQAMAPFGVIPDRDLAVMQSHQTLTQLTAACMQGLEPVLLQEKPQLVLVHGDTTTALAGALTAFHQGIPVGHVEAGLRSGSLKAPFPEEGNRRLIDQLSTLRFCPTRENLQNLVREGLGENSLVTGNTGVDALSYLKGGDWETPALAEREASGRPMVTITCHRRENRGEPLGRVLSAVRRLAEQFPQWTLVWPVHPAVADVVNIGMTQLDNVLVLPPLGVGEMHRLIAGSAFLLTDSGGLQEEGAALGTPVLLLRENTERPEGVQAGLARLVGTEEEAILAAAQELMRDPGRLRAMSEASNPYGDGSACRRIVAAIRDWGIPSGKASEEHQP